MGGVGAGKGWGGNVAYSFLKSFKFELTVYPDRDESCLLPQCAVSVTS